MDSEQGWTPIAAIDWDSRDIDSPLEGVTRRWRLRTNYEYTHSSGPSTIQIRLRGAAAGQTFTHPWSDGADRKADAYSNWFEDTDSSLGRAGRGYVEARLIAPPRVPLTGKLFSITLEAWDTNHEFDQGVDFEGRIQQAVLGVEMEVNKTLAHLFPLDSARRFRGQIVNHAVDSFDFVDDAAGCFLQKFRPGRVAVGGHAVHALD